MGTDSFLRLVSQHIEFFVKRKGVFKVEISDKVSKAVNSHVFPKESVAFSSDVQHLAFFGEHLTKKRHSLLKASLIHGSRQRSLRPKDQFFLRQYVAIRDEVNAVQMLILWRSIFFIYALVVVARISMALSSKMLSNAGAYLSLL